MQFRLIVLIFAVSFAPNAILFAQEDDIRCTATTSYHITEKGLPCEEIIVNFYRPQRSGKPEVELELRLGEKLVEVVDGRYPSMFHDEDYFAVEASPKQFQDFWSIRKIYASKMKMEIQAALDSSEGKLTDMELEKLVQRLKIVHSEQEIEADNILLDHQKLLLMDRKFQRWFKENNSKKLSESKIADPLNLTEEQLKLIKEIEEKYNALIKDQKENAEVEAKKVYDERKRKILSTLDNSARQKIQLLIEDK